MTPPLRPGDIASEWTIEIFPLGELVDEALEGASLPPLPLPEVVVLGHHTARELQVVGKRRLLVQRRRGRDTQGCMDLR